MLSLKCLCVRAEQPPSQQATRGQIAIDCAEWVQLWDVSVEVAASFLACKSSDIVQAK